MKLQRPTKQSGFSIVEASLIVFVVVALAATSFVVYQRHKPISIKNSAATGSTQTTTQPKTTDTTTTPAQPVDPYAEWKIYSDQQAHITFKYPADWTSKINPNSYYTTGTNFAGTSGTLTSPNGNTLTWIFQVIGGKGDAGCTPNPNDTPFSPGDKCASKQIISVEQIPSVRPAPGQTFRSLFGDSLYITETKVDTGASGSFASYPGATPPANDTTTYQVCLDPYTANEGLDPPKIGTVMGFELPCEYWDTGFGVIFPVKSATDFNSPDAKTAILIMKSFNSI
jgi:Tfp pilus assembly protein PilV